jgi:transposase
MDAKLEGKYKQKRYFCADESRFGLRTILRRLITKVGVKPSRPAQMLFKAFWLYGAVEPATGESVFWHYSHVDTKCFQHFINDLAQKFPDSLNFLQLDNAKFHKSKSLKIPENIILLFQPPYSPELNPIERMWGYIKQFLAWDLFDNLEQLHQKVDEVLLSLTSEVISSVTAFRFILDALSVAPF